MKKNTGKVLSLILALAMIVTSFSATFSVSAATASRETGGRVTLNDDEIYVAASEDEDNMIIEGLNGYADMTAFDREDVYDVEFSSWTHASGDRLVKTKVNDNDDDDHDLYVKKNASGTEVITMTYKGTVDRDDKSVTVTGSTDMTIHAYTVGDYVLKQYVGATASDDDLDDPETIAINNQSTQYGIYEITDNNAGTNYMHVVGYQLSKATKASISSDEKVFTIVDDGTATGMVEIAPYVKDGAKYASTGSANLTVYYGTGSSDKIKTKITVGKKWEVTRKDAEVMRKGGNTYITVTDSADFDDDEKGGTFYGSNRKDNFQAVNGYELVQNIANGSITITSGSLGNVTVKGAGSTITMKDGNVGNLKAIAGITVEDGTAGTLKNCPGATISVEGGKVSAVDAEKATFDISGGAVSGKVVCSKLVVSSDDENATTISGDINVKDKSAAGYGDGSVDINSGDMSVQLTGALKFAGDFTASGDNVTLGTLNADYNDIDNVDFSDFTGTVKALNGMKNASMTAEGDSIFSIADAVEASSVDVEDGSVVTFSALNVEEISGEGMIVIPANALYVKSSMSDIKVKLAGDFDIGTIAFSADADSVDVEDFTPVGYTVSKKSVNDSTDAFVIGSVVFAGASFDKSSVEIAKGYSADVTVNAYPKGTSLPTGDSIELTFEAAGNEDNFEVTRDGNVVTIKALGYNADYDTDNYGTLTATIVDKDGYALDDYVVATCDVKIVAAPASLGVLRADTTSYTLAPGAIYDIKFTVTGTDAAPVVTDSRTGSVFTLTDLGGGKYRVTGVKAGLAYVVATVGNTHVSVAVTVADGAASAGVKGDNYADIYA